MGPFRRAGLGAALAVTLASYGVSVQAKDREKLAMARLRLTTEAQTLPPNCTLVGTVKDDSMEDLRKKIVRAGGDTGLLSFPSDDLSIIYAKVYRCPAYSPSGPPPPPPPPPTR
jgi:hypothetical protein